MNVKLLEKVKAQILAEPAQFVMGPLFAKSVQSDDSPVDLARSIPNCGTAACIAGWALTLGRKFSTPAEANEAIGMFGSGDEAARLLRLQDEPASNLFHVSEWPARFRARWHRSRSLETRAKVACERISHFIKTDGAE